MRPAKSNANTPKINWTTKPNANAGRQRACDVIRSAVSTVRYADGINTIDDCFSKFINADMIVEMIVLGSNIKINSYLENHSDKVGHHKYPFLRITDFIEIRALIGLIFFVVLGLHNHKVDILFSSKAGHPVFGATMGRKRFKFLFNNLMFDDVATREVDWQQDRFTTIREFFEIFNRNCMNHVIPSEYLSIDETLYPMRTQVRIKQYKPNKPAKYGLLFKSLNDARFPHTYQSLPYAGKPAAGEGPYYLNKTEDYVKKLVEEAQAKLLIQGRNISMDHLYTSISLANWLYERDIIIGTLMTNRIGIPAEIKKTDNRPELCTTVHWEAEEKNLVLRPYAVKTKSKGMKSVLLLSTMSVIRSYT